MKPGGGPARVLLVAGLEPSGRAGLLADVETARALGASSLAVASALTAQGTRTFATRAAPALLVRRQLEALLELGGIDAVKLGMVPDAQVMRAVVRALAGGRAPWVVDPVVRSSKGERLSSLGARDYLGLAGGRVVLTPNLLEARWLLGWRRPVDSPERAAQAAAQLLETGFWAVVLKGGHSGGAAVDVVATRGEVALLEGPRLPRGTLTHRGTGCRFATALAVGLARGPARSRQPGRPRPTSLDSCEALYFPAQPRAGSSRSVSLDVKDELAGPVLAQGPVHAVRLAQQVFARPHPLVGKDRPADANADEDLPVAPLGL